MYTLIPWDNLKSVFFANNSYTFNNKFKDDKQFSQ